MTRQEAIKWLYNLKKDIGKMQHQALWHYEQALDEIIEALEQEPSCRNTRQVDLISRDTQRGEKAKTLFMNLYNCEKFENLSNGVVYMKIPECSIYDEIGREWIVNCVRQDNFECCFTHAFERVERIKGE